MVVNFLSEKFKSQKKKKSIKFSPFLFRHLSKMSTSHIHFHSLQKIQNLVVKRICHCLYVYMYIAILRIERRTLSVLGKCSATELHLHTKCFGFHLVKNMFSGYNKAGS